MGDGILAGSGDILRISRSIIDDHPADCRNPDTADLCSLTPCARAGDMIDDPSHDGRDIRAMAADRGDVAAFVVLRRTAAGCP